MSENVYLYRIVFRFMILTVNPRIRWLMHVLGVHALFLCPDATTPSLTLTQVPTTPLDLKCVGRTRSFWVHPDKHFRFRRCREIFGPTYFEYQTKKRPPPSPPTGFDLIFMWFGLQMDIEIAPLPPSPSIVADLESSVKCHVPGGAVSNKYSEGRDKSAFSQWRLADRTDDHGIMRSRLRIQHGSPKSEGDFSRAGRNGGE